MTDRCCGTTSILDLGYDFGNVEELIEELQNDTNIIVDTIQIEGHIICTLTPNQGNQLFDVLGMLPKLKSLYVHSFVAPLQLLTRLLTHSKGLHKLVLHTAQLSGGSSGRERDHHNHHHNNDEENNTNNNVPISEAEDFIQALENLPQLREVRLSNLVLANGFTLDQLVSSLASIPSLEVLDLELEQGGNLQSSQALFDLCSNHNNNNNNNRLRELRLWRLAISVDHIRAMVEALTTNTTLEEIELGELGNEDHDDETYVDILPQLFLQNHCLTTFSLMNFSGLSSVGCTAIFHALQVNTTLQSFSIRGCDNCILDKDGAIALSQLLEHNHTLQQLSMNSIGLDDHGAHLIGKALQQNPTTQLKTLIFQKIVGQLQKAFASWLEMVKNNHVLERLYPEATGQVKREIDFYLYDLNQLRLRNLQLNVNATRKDFLDTLIQHRHYVERIFYLLTMNPSFCTK